MTTSPVMDLLAHGVPLSLLLDLTNPAGPDSAAINATERPPNDPLLLELCTVIGTRDARAV